MLNSDGSVFFNGLKFVEKCAFSFEDKHRITYIWRGLMNICLNQNGYSELCASGSQGEEGRDA